MGIRFDKDARRATNGPLLFFSDFMAEEAFAEEINGAIISGLSFYAYKTASSPMVTFGSSEGYVEGFGTPGFVIGRFDNSLPFITIPFKGAGRNTSALNSYHYPDTSTTFEEYKEEVTEILKDVKKIPGGKVVAARVILQHEKTDIAEKFYKLCKKFPESYVFAFSTPATGCWIGASPELLLKREGECMETMSLAGTRLSGTNSPWDYKNKEEQEIVTRYIGKVFTDNGLNPSYGETFTKQSGNIEHLCTPIKVNINPGNDFNPELIIRTLYPTPALAGFPKEFALNEIRKLEKFDRGCYGGFCGIFRALNDFSFQVIIRCAAMTDRKLAIYTGGGITSESDVESEWNETCIKAENTFDIKI